MDLVELYEPMMKSVIKKYLEYAKQLHRKGFKYNWNK